MRSVIAFGVLLSLATVVHAAQGGGRGAKPWTRTVQGVIAVDMLGDRVMAPARLTLQRHGDQLYSRSVMRMPDGQIRRSPVTRGTIVRLETRNGATMMGVKYGGNSYRRQAQGELNDMLAAHGLDLTFHFDRVEGVTTHLIRRDGSIQMDSTGLVSLRGLGGGLAQQLAPHLEQLAPGGRFELQASGLFKPVARQPR